MQNCGGTTGHWSTSPSGWAAVQRGGKSPAAREAAGTRDRALPDQAQRSRGRRVEPVAVARADPGSREVEVRHKREALCKGGPSRSSDVFVFGAATDLRAQVRVAAQGGLLRAVAAFETSKGVERPLKMRFALELFCGTARWSRAMGRRGYYCIAIDLRFGGEHNLCGRELQRRINGWIQAHWVIAVLAGFRALRSAARGTCREVLQPSGRLTFCTASPTCGRPTKPRSTWATPC